MNKHIQFYLFMIFVLFVSGVYFVSASCARSFDLELLKKGAMKGRDVDEYLYGRELVLGEYPVEKKMEGIRYLKKISNKGICTSNNLSSPDV